MKFDNVMVPLDGSLLSDMVLDIATNSGEYFGTHLTFLYVVDVSQAIRFGEVDSTATVIRLRTEGKIVLENAAKLAESRNIECTTELVEGVPWKVISEKSKEQDMIIMGVTGKSGLAAGRVGETAAKVIESCFCPVLTIKSGSKQIKDILLPITNEHMAAIDIAIETAKRVDGHITVFSSESKHVKPEELVNSVVEKCEVAGVKATGEVGHGDAVEAIVSRSGKYDLVIMGTEGRQGLKKILNGSVAERVMTNAACPVTIVRDF